MVNNIISEKDCRKFLAMVQESLPNKVFYCSCPSLECNLICRKAKKWIDFNLSENLTLPIPYLDCEKYLKSLA